MPSRKDSKKLGNIIIKYPFLGDDVVDKRVIPYPFSEFFSGIAWLIFDNLILPAISTESSR
jgi:hypothetical protein